MVPAQTKYNQPISLHGTNGTAVLLIHGFTSSPVVFEELSVALNEKGYSVLAPVLAGHGTCAEDLAQTTWKDWLLSVQDAYDELSTTHRKIFIIGASFGSNLAALIASDHRLKGLIMIGFPRFLQKQIPAKFLYTYLKATGKPYFIKAKRGQDDEALFSDDTVAYKKIPIINIGHLFFLLFTLTDRALKKIVCPTLIIQSENDGLLSSKSAPHALKLLAATHKQLFWVNDPHYKLHRGKSKDQIFSTILAFLARWD